MSPSCESIDSGILVNNNNNKNANNVENEGNGNGILNTNTSDDFQVSLLILVRNCFNLM